MAVYEAGYINATNGSDQVEGLGTGWLAYCKKGDTLTLQGTLYYIIAITDNHRLQLHTVYTGTTLARGNYQIVVVDKPGLFYIFNVPTLAWIASAPAPAIQSLVVTLGLKNIQLAWSVVDAVYPAIAYQTEVWHNSVDNFATATLLSTLSGTAVKYSDLPVAAHYYWLRAVNTAYAITAATTASGVQVPVAVQTGDIAHEAVSISAFGSSPYAVTGLGGTAYSSILSWSVTNPKTVDLPFSLEHFCKQIYTAGAKQTRWIVQRYHFDTSTYTPVKDFGLFNAVDELPVLSLIYAVPPGETHTLVFFWWGEDGTVSIQDRSFNFIGLLV